MSIKVVSNDPLTKAEARKIVKNFDPNWEVYAYFDGKKYIYQFNAPETHEKFVEVKRWYRKLPFEGYPWPETKQPFEPWRKQNINYTNFKQQPALKSSAAVEPTSTSYFQPKSRTTTINPAKEQVAGSEVEAISISDNSDDSIGDHNNKSDDEIADKMSDSSGKPLTKKRVKKDSTFSRKDEPKKNKHKKCVLCGMSVKLSYFDTHLRRQHVNNMVVDTGTSKPCVRGSNKIKQPIEANLESTDDDMKNMLSN